MRFNYEFVPSTQTQSILVVLLRHPQNVPGRIRTRQCHPYLMEHFHHPDNIKEDDNGLFLCQLLLLDDKVLQVDEVCVLVTKLVVHQAVQHQNEAATQPTSVLCLTMATKPLLQCLILTQIKHSCNEFVLT